MPGSTFFASGLRDLLALEKGLEAHVLPNADGDEGEGLQDGPPHDLGIGALGNVAEVLLALALVLLLLAQVAELVVELADLDLDGA